MGLFKKLLGEVTNASKYQYPKKPSFTVDFDINSLYPEAIITMMDTRGVDENCKLNDTSAASILRRL